MVGYFADKLLRRWSLTRRMMITMKNNFFGVRGIGIMVFFAISPSVAMAYIDPGNGAYMVQVLFTLVGAGLFYLKHPIRTIRAIRDWLVNRWKLRSSSIGGPGSDSEHLNRSEVPDARSEQSEGRSGS